MKIFYFEIKKLFYARYLWAFWALFLVVNVFLSYESAQQAGSKADLQAMADFCVYYSENQDELDAYYHDLKAIQAAIDADSWMAEDAPESELTQMPPNRYAPEGASDMDWIAIAGQARASAKTQASQSTLDSVLRAAELQIGELSETGKEDSYSYRFQVQTRDVYRGLRDTVAFQNGYVYGWGNYLSYNAHVVLMFFSALLLAVTVMSFDRTVDMLPIIHCTTRGKRSTMGAKVAVMGAGAVLIVLLFSLSTYVVFALNTGFSDAREAIQAVSGVATGNTFKYVPFPVTIGEYHAMLLFVRCLGLLVFVALMAVISSFVKNNMLSVLIGLLIYGGNLYLSGRNYMFDNHVLKNLNLIQVTDARHVLERFRAMQLGDWAIPYIPLTIGACIALGACAFGIGSEIYIKHMNGNSHCSRRFRMVEWVSSAARRIKERFPTPELQCGSLVKSEFYKLLFPSGMAVLIVILTILKIGYAMNLHTPIESTSDKVYYDYLTRLEGPVTLEKLESLEEERRILDETLSIYGQMQKAYLSGDVSAGQYFDYLEAYATAEIKDGYLKLIENRRDYLLSLQEDGRDGWFVYDFGWSKFFDPGVDFFLLIALSVTISSIFAVEYKNGDTSDGFARILRSTSKGRRPTFNAKIWVISWIAAGLCVLYGAIDIAIMTSRYVLPASEAPLLSIPTFISFDGTMTIGQYILIYLIARLFFGLLLGKLVTVLSAVLKRNMTALLGVASILIIPAILEVIGFDMAGYVNYLSFLAVTPLIVKSFSVDLFGSDYGLLLLTAILTLMVIVGLTLWIRHKYEE